MYRDDNTQSRSWFNVTGGILFALLAANIAVFDIIAIIALVQYLATPSR